MENEKEVKTIEDELSQAFSDAGLTGEPEDGSENEPGTQDGPGDQAQNGEQKPGEGTEPADGGEGDGSPADGGGSPAPTDEGTDGDGDPDPKGDESKGDDEPKLILGKFKSQEELEKAYVNLQKMASQKAQKNNEERKFTSPDEFEEVVAQRIETVVLKQIEDAISRIPDQEQLKEASAAVTMYRRTGDLKFIARARDFLDRAADRRLENDVRQATLAIKQDMSARRDQIMMEPIRQGLTELEQEDPEWLAEPLHQDVLKAAIQLNHRVDVKSIKKMINEIATNAVEKYKAKEAKKRVVENSKKPNISIKPSPGIVDKKPAKPLASMSLEEQLQAAYDKKFGEN